MKTDRRKTDHNPDARLSYTVVMFLGWISALGVLGLLLLSAFHMEPNAALYTIVGNLTGALGAILTSTRSNQRATDAPPTPVEVTNSPQNPVPTTEEAQPDEEQPTDA